MHGLETMASEPMHSDLDSRGRDGDGGRNENTVELIGCKKYNQRKEIKQELHETVVPLIKLGWLQV